MKRVIPPHPGYGDPMKINEDLVLALANEVTLQGVREILQARTVGATGKFPRGQLNPSDEGGLQLAIAADPVNGVVRVDFGKPVAWLGLDPDTADQFAESLRVNAREVRNQT